MSGVEKMAYESSFKHPSLQQVGILFVGHGTRVEAGRQQFKKLFEQFAQCVAPVASEMAYLELAEPDIPTAMERLFSDGEKKKLLVVPALLFTAGHAESDIPQAVRRSLSSNKLCSRDVQWIGQTEALECNARVMQLSAKRFRQAVCPAECESGCTESVCSRTTWILIGRGSSSSTAAAKMRQFTRLRQEWTPVQNALTAFIYGQKPLVGTTLQAVSGLDTEMVVVQPHLLFSGRLLEGLQNQVEEMGRKNVQQKWVLTEPLGSDRLLAELWSAIALDALKPEISAWETAKR